MNYASVLVSGQSNMAEVLTRLIDRSQYFAVTPYPDDHWKVTVKEENRQLIAGYGICIFCFQNMCNDLRHSHKD